MVFGAILGAKMVPKWVQKSIKKMMDFWIALGSALGRLLWATADSYPPLLGPRGPILKGGVNPSGLQKQKLASAPPTTRLARLAFLAFPGLASLFEASLAWLG